MSTTCPQGFATRAVHAGQSPDPATGARAVPIHQTTSYVFQDTEQAAKLFALQAPGHIYSRISNPTNEAFEECLADLEGGSGALATASGHAAEFIAICTLASAGDEIVSATTLYGGTYNLFAHTLPRLGITVRFVDPSDPAGFGRALSERTRAVYVETIGNPRLDVADLSAIGAIARTAGVPLIVDNTFATPYLCRPFEHGADVVVHSATKFIGGHGTSIGGAIVDSGRFDWANGRFAALTQPDPSYHGLCWTEAFGPGAFIARARAAVLRDIGACLSPFNAWLFLQGLATLPLRMARHSESALRVARFLAEHPAVTWVRYPALAGDPCHDLARRYLPGGAGAVVAFGVRGGLEAGRALIGRLRLFSHLANVGDARSLVIHPASTTHSQLNPAQLAASGVGPDLIRLSVGLEDPEDLCDDLALALRP